MNSNGLITHHDYYYGCESRISLHQANNEQNNGIVDVAIPFPNDLSDSMTLDFN